MKYNTGDKVNFEVRTHRKGERFSLSWNGNLTIDEPSTAKEVMKLLAEAFLEDTNSRLPKGKKQYATNEVTVTLEAA